MTTRDNTDKAPPSDEQVASAKQLLLRKLLDAPRFQSNGASSNAAEKYCEEVATSMRRTWSTRAAFRDHLQVIVANVGLIKPALDEFDPDALGKMAPSDIMSKRVKARHEKLRMKRSRESDEVDDTRIHCDQCGFVRRTRLNLNRMALDSEDLGSQFEYNFDNVCECGADVIPEVEIRKIDDSSDSDDEIAAGAAGATKSVDSSKLAEAIPDAVVPERSK